MENKSYLLDELRLEVGSVREQVQTLLSFYAGISKIISTKMNECFSISIYETNETSFIRKVSSGPTQEEAVIPFGESILSIVAVRGNHLYRRVNGMQKIYLPFYHLHHLLGIIIFSVPLDRYRLSEDDFIFMKEVGRFIEVQHQTFFSQS
ncbi:hypothetical protein [Bacillus suaedae]|uniref:GAF domain-containing protein n=1 Tax=Halalkalibacter suaedae TaxID=2822140 RepID=A0A941AQ35_9BACI|nr:hypothetical protein [Bacillus suaedae]MBP3952182.1 hypothetical protein [Bacillus suaedae]